MILRLASTHASQAISWRLGKIVERPLPARALDSDVMGNNIHDTGSMAQERLSLPSISAFSAVDTTSMPAPGDG